MQPKGQHHRKPDPQDQSEALQEPQISLMVGLSSRVLMGVRWGSARPPTADLGENMHCGHVEERPSREEHSHSCRAELILRGAARLRTQNTSNQIILKSNCTTRHKMAVGAFLLHVIWSKWWWQVRALQLRRPANVPECASFQGLHASGRRPTRKQQVPRILDQELILFLLSIELDTMFLTDRFSQETHLV